MSADGTKDLDAVVERVQRTAVWLREKYVAVENGTFVDGQKVYDDLMTLLAAVSRPAEARGEPVAWMMERDTPRAHSLRFTCDETEAQHESRSGYKVTPLYAAPRPEPGEVSEAMVEAAYAVMRDQYRDKALISVTAVRESLRAALAAREGA